VRIHKDVLASTPVVVTTYSPDGQVVQIELTQQYLDTLSYD